MRWLFAVVIVALLMGFGCSSKDRVTEGDRELSAQNVGAAKVIQEKTDDPAIKAPARDVELNSEQQLKNWGPPKAVKPYSAAASEESRKKSEKEHASPWWMIALTGIGGFLAGAAPIIMRGLGLVAPTFAAGPAGTALTAVIEGIARVRENVQARPEGQRTLGEQDILAVLARVQDAAGVRDLVKNISNKVEDKLSRLL